MACVFASASGSSNGCVRPNGSHDARFLVIRRSGGLIVGVRPGDASLETVPVIPSRVEGTQEVAD